MKTEELFDGEREESTPLGQPRDEKYLTKFTNALATFGFDKDGKQVMQCLRSSFDPSGDHDMMQAFLELEQAYRLRSVEIKGHKIGSLWVTSNPPEAEGFVDRDFTTQVGMQRMLNWVITRCEAAGFVASITNDPEPGIPRMGGYRMRGLVRKNLATVRREAEELVRVVRKSNFDEEVFEEVFDGDAMPRRCAEEICAKMNAGDGLNPIWYAVVPLDYKLYKWEP